MDPVAKFVEVIDFEKIEISLKNEFDKKLEHLDMKKAIEVAKEYHKGVVKMTENENQSVNELFKTVRDFTRSLNINLPKNMHLETYFKGLKKVNKAKLISSVFPSWSNLLQNLVKHIKNTEIWYIFLDGLYSKFSEYEVLRNRKMYNVAQLDSGKSDKTQGIAITESNFKKFLENIVELNISEYDTVKKITLSKLRLHEINQLVDLTLDQKLDVKFVESSVFVRADYVSLKEVAAYECSEGDRHINLLAVLKSGSYKFLQIFALKKVFFDEDITLPGFEVRIISPIWEIIGTRTISLDGMDGESHSETKAEDGVLAGSDGKDGEPGLPGKPGGNFFGIGESIVNGVNLTVTVNGGNGGPGQHGGQGKEGSPGRDVEYLTDTDLPIFDDERIIRIKGFPCQQTSRWLTYPKFKIPKKNAVYKISGLPGKIGGNGGNGGKGGSGGNPGNISIFQLKEDLKINILAKQGDNGENGSGGGGGRGGINGQGLLAQIESERSILPILCPQRVIKWIYQRNDPNEMRASKGKEGKCGLNIEDLEKPSPSNAIFEPSKNINAYKNYAMENLRFRFKKTFLLQFLASMNASSEIQGMYDVFGFIYEMQDLERGYSRLRGQLDFVPFYHSLLDRITSYENRIKGSENMKEHKKILCYLKTATLSKICILRDKSQNNLIIDISRYLDVLKKDIKDVKDLQAVFDETSKREKLKKDYEDRIISRIKEAKDFITKQILPELNFISDDINNNFNLLLKETLQLQEKTKNETESLNEKKNELKRTMALKLLLDALKLVARGLKLLGPVGETVASIIETATSFADSPILSNKETAQDQFPNLETVENEKETFKIETMHLVKLLEQVLNKSKDYPEVLQDSNKTRVNTQDKNHNGSAASIQNIEALEEESNLEVESQAEIIEDQPEGSSKKIQKPKKPNDLISSLLYFSSTTDKAEMEETENAIKQKEEKFNCLKLYAEKIYNSIIPMIKTMKDYFYGVGNRLDSESRVTLSIAKWGVQGILKKLQLAMQELTRGFQVETKVVICVEMLEEAVTILINIYDWIQHYEEQKILFDYIADISSSTTSSINICDPKLAKALGKMDMAIKSNQILKYYKTAKDAFKQWAFPFSEYYLQDMPRLSFESEDKIDNLASKAISCLEYMKKQVGLYKTSVTEKDKNFHYGYFNSQLHTSQPFFVWQVGNEMKLDDLLSGHEVILKAQIRKSPMDKQAIKFNCIDFYLRSNDQSLQSELTEALKTYDITAIHMGISYYRYDGKIILIMSNSQTISFSFEKSGTGECVRSNAVYNKIKNGDLMLSPYAIWKIKLENRTKKDDLEENYKDLEKYKGKISLELIGKGSYVTEVEASGIDDRSYNIVGLYTELDQYLD